MQDNENSLLDKDSVLHEATPSNISRDNIESLAEKISKQFKLTDFSGEADPLSRFVKILGGRIHYQNPPGFSESESGSIKVYGQNDFDLYLSTFTGPLRDRFTIAHELGHYFVHSNQGERQIRASRKGSGQLEWEANWFAAALLMPSNEFKTISTKFSGDDYSIAGHFQVSLQAVTIRHRWVLK